MKKIISIALLLAMCLSIFAGCAPKAEEGEPSLLSNAKAYLINMYQTVGKDEVIVLVADKDILSKVTIDGIGFAVEWSVKVTSGNSDDVKIGTSAKANHVKLDINEMPAEELLFTATATIKAPDGATETASFNYKVAASERPGTSTGLSDGTYVIVTNNLTFSALSTDKSYGYAPATNVTVTNGVVSGYVAADIVTIKNVDEGFTMQDAHGRYIYLKGTYNSFNVDTTVPDEGHAVWQLVTDKDGNSFIVNKGTMKTLAYDTGYTSWGAYPELTDAHLSNVIMIAATAPEGGDNAGDNTGDNAGNNSGNNSGNNTPSTPSSKGDHINYTVDTLGLQSQSYTSATNTVGGIGVEWVQLGNYGDGIQMRDKDGKTSMFWNTTAMPNKIIKIEFTFNSAKTIYGDNKMIVNFGKSAKGADCAMTLTTVSNQATYVITPNGDYKYFYIEWDTGYSSYWDSIKVYCDGVSTGTSGTPSTPSTPSEPSTPSTPSTPTTPSTPSGDKVTVADGQYIIYVPAFNMALSSEYTGYYNKGVAFSEAGATETWTITNNSDGTICISYNGQKLAMGDSFSSMPLGEKNDKWVLIDAGDGLVYIQNVARQSYIEWYSDKSNWSSYATIAEGKEGLFAIKLVAA